MQQEALCKGPGTCVTKGMLSKTQGSDSVQETQGLPQQLGTPAPNGPKIPSAHGHHQMINTKIRLIIFFAAKDGEALYSQQKQDQELTMAQIMSSLLPNSD